MCGGHYSPLAQDTVSPPASRAKIVALLNLSPWQSWEHLFCDRTAPACSVTFWCRQQMGDPVTWEVTVGAGWIFTYWPNEMEAGNPADLQAAPINAGLLTDDARRRKTYIVRSNDPIDARAYTYISGQIVPVANQAGTAAVTRYAPTDQAAFDGRFVGKRMEWNLPTRNHYDTTSPGRFRLTTVNDLTLAGDSRMKIPGRIRQRLRPPMMKVTSLAESH